MSFGDQPRSQELFPPSRSFPSSNFLSTPKKRSLSDSARPPSLEPSPEFREAPRTQDDIDTTPTRSSKKLDLSAPAVLRLQMPTKDTSPPVQSPPQSQSLGLGLGLQSSPQIEPSQSYGSPSSVLPRHSRGMDFSRAATNLHHSTIAEQPSPGSSPIISQKQMLPPSRRDSTYSMALDSPRASGSWSWSMPDKAAMPRSVGSTNAMTSEASSSSSDDDDDALMAVDDDADTMLWTPQANKTTGGVNVTPYENKQWMAENTPPLSMHSPSAFSSYRRNVLSRRNDRGVHHHPYRHALRTSSPEPSSNFPARPQSNGSIDVAMQSPRSRRDSISLGIGNALHITTSNEDNDEREVTSSGVVRRPVTRRSNMLPRTKNFARIRAALQEESCPVDTDVRRESEVVRQVRENDTSTNTPRPTKSAMTSPDLTPSVPNPSAENSLMSDVEALGVKGGLGLASGALSDLRRASIQGRDFWQNQRKRSATPPFSGVLNRHRSSSGAMSEDMSVGIASALSTPPSSTSLLAGVDAAKPTTNHPTTTTSLHQPPAAATFPTFPSPPAPAPASIHQAGLPTASDLTRRINNKRVRDAVDAGDPTSSSPYGDYGVNSYKRRAVSPGMSVASSPVLGQSPVGSFSSGGAWGSMLARGGREGSVPATTVVSGDNSRERSNSNSLTQSNSSGQTQEKSGTSMSLSLTPQLGPKRVGLQGMTDTNDGLMSMTLE